MFNKNKKEVFTEKFVDTILKAMEKDTNLNWLNPIYFTPRSSYNATSQRAYSGVNALLLNLTSHMNSYKYNAWLTFNQAVTLGKRYKTLIHVKKNESAVPIIFFDYVDKNKELNDLLKLEGRDDECIYDYRCMTQQYYVFNVEQIEWNGFDYTKLLRGDEPLPLDIDLKKKKEEDIINFFLEDYPNPPTVQHGLTKSGACYYTPTYDTVNVAPIECFRSEEAFISTLAHELVHSTGYETRLNRLEGGTFGSEKYSKEELVAELGASMICSMVGIKERVFDNQVAYLKSWLHALKDNPTWLFSAFSKATKALEYMGFETK